MVFAASITIHARMGKQTSTGTAKRLAASCMNLLVYSIGLVAFASIPAVRENWPIAHYIWRNNIYDPPETYFSIVTSNAVSCGLISWCVYVQDIAIICFSPAPSVSVLFHAKSA
jgi:hypothetical protein